MRIDAPRLPENSLVCDHILSRKGTGVRAQNLPRFWIVLFFLSISLSQPVLAFSPQPTLIVKSQYFNVYGPRDVNIIEILYKLNYDYFLQFDALLSKEDSNPKAVLGKTLDAVFLESCKILGITVYSFEASIEFLADRETIKIVLREVAGIDVHRQAFYFHELKTIYVSLADLSVGVLAHEMAHSVISHYFGAPPSSNIQEILAGYVDYTLRKSSGTHLMSDPENEKTPVRTPPEHLLRR